MKTLAQKIEIVFGPNNSWVQGKFNYFLPLERFLFQCARFSFLDAHSSL